MQTVRLPYCLDFFYTRSTSLVGYDTGDGCIVFESKSKLFLKYNNILLY